MGTAEEREAFWRSHHEAWRRSDLNQREYCEAHGLVLKRFENWRVKFRDEPEVRRKLLYRRGGPSHMTGHMTVPMTNGMAGSMSMLAAGAAGRRRFSEDEKRRIVDEASQPGCSVSQTARRYGIAARVLFRWKDALKPKPTEPTFAPVQVVADREPAADAAAPSYAPVIVDRSAPGIEVELVGGRRVRFERDADPETVRRLVALLEGGTS